MPPSQGSCVTTIKDMLLPEPDEYIELELYIAKSFTAQFLGARRQHREMRLDPRFHVELDPIEP
jgi:hypothetical protein